MKILVFAVSVVATLVLTGCVSPPENLQVETARVIGGRPADQIAVSDVHGAKASLSWKATTPDGLFSCQMADSSGLVTCVKELCGACIGPDD